MSDPTATRAESWTVKRPQGVLSVKEYNDLQRQQWHRDYGVCSNNQHWYNVPQLACYLFFNQRSPSGEERKTGYIAWKKFEGANSGHRAVWGKTKAAALALVN